MGCCHWSNLFKCSSCRCCVDDGKCFLDQDCLKDACDFRSTREVSRWQQITSIIQQWRLSQSSSSSCDNGAFCLNRTLSEEVLDDNDASYDVPILLSAFRYERNSQSVPFRKQNPSLDRDILFVISQHRQGFLLPKFYPRSLHIINNESTFTETSVKYDKKRRNSDPYLCGLRSKWTNNCDKTAIFRDFNHFRRVHRYRERKTSDKQVGAVAGGITHNLRHKISDFISVSKSYINFNPRQSDDRPIDESNEIDALIQPVECSKLLITECRSEIKSQHLQLIDSSQKLTVSNESITLEEDIPGSESIKDVMQANASVNLESWKESMGVRETVIILEKEIKGEASSSNVVKLKKPEHRDQTFSAGSSKSSISASSRSKEAVVSTFKQFQGTVENFKSNIIKKFEQSRQTKNKLELKSKSLDKQNSLTHETHTVNSSTEHLDEELLSEEVDLPTKKTVETSSSLPNNCLSTASEDSFDHNDDCSGEPVPKHRRSLSMPEERQIYFAPSKPVRGKFIYKRKKAFQRDNEGNGSIRDEQHSSRREFIINMVHDGDDEANESYPHNFEMAEESPHLLSGQELTNAEHANDLNKSYASSEKQEVNKDEQIISDIKVSVNPSLSTQSDTIKENNMCIVNIATPHKIYKQTVFQELPLPDINCNNDAIINDLIDEKSDLEEEVPNEYEYTLNAEFNKHGWPLLVQGYSKSCDLELDEFPLKILKDDKVHRNNKSAITEDSNYAPSKPVINYCDEISGQEISSSTDDEIKNLFSSSGDANISKNVVEDIPVLDINSKDTNVAPFASSRDEGHAPAKDPVFIQSGSQPQIYITPADDINEEACTKILSDPTSQNDISQSTSTKVLACSLDTQSTTALPSDIDGLSPSVTNNSFNTDRRPTTPKSPITVQEWVDSLPDNRVDTHEVEWRDDTTFVLEDQPNSFHKKITVKETTAEGVLLLGDDASALTPAEKKLVKEKVSHTVAPIKSERPPPLTLSDIHRELIRKENEGYALSKLGHKDKRNLFSNARENQFSFQSETSNYSCFSHPTTISSIDSLLESRQPDPVDILMNLGFGGNYEVQGVARIPARFMHASKVPGNDINVFLRQEVNISALEETSEWVVPGISTQALRKSSVVLLSPLVSNLLESLREGQNRRLQKTLSQESSVSNSRNFFRSKFTNVARGLGKKAIVMSHLANVLERKRSLFGSGFSSNEDGRNSVLNVENRRFLDLQGQKSPEVPDRRIILGGESYNLGRNGEIIDDKKKPSSDETSNKTTVEQPSSSLRHRDSVASLMSSTTSIDSREEEHAEELSKLRLSLMRRNRGTIVDNTRISSNDKKKNLIMRLSNSSSKKKSYTSQSSGSSWEVDNFIPEESSESLYNQIIPEDLIDTDECLSDVFENDDSEQNLKEDIDNKNYQLKKDLNKNPFFPEKTPINNSPSSSSSEDDNSLSASFAKCKKKSVIRKPNSVEKDLRDLQISNSPREELDSIKNMDIDSSKKSDMKRKNSKQGIDKNWTIESTRKVDTFKRFPLSRNLALTSSDVNKSFSPLSPVSIEKGSSASGSKKSSLRTVPLHKTSVIENLIENEMRRTSSLPTVLIEEEDANLESSKSHNKSVHDLADKENIKNGLESLQQNVNTALLAVLQTCKSQLNLQEMISTGTLNTGSSLSMRSLKSKSNDSSSFKGSRETLEVASQMKHSIHSVIGQLEHYLNDVTPQFQGSQPNISNTVGKMLWLSHLQSDLCSELERLSSPDLTSHSPSQGSSHLGYPSSCRSMPEQLNVSSPPFHSPIPPMSPLFLSSFPSYSPKLSSNYNNHLPLGVSPNSKVSDSIAFRNQRFQASLSESSLEGSVDLGGENSIHSEWNESKRSGISSPLYQWPSSISSDGILDDIVKEKISQEIQESLSPKVNQMNTNMAEMSSTFTQMREHLEKNSKDVSDLKKHLQFLIEKLSTSN